MAREWTALQLEAINANGELLISAAAGAGKTSVLTERISRLIYDGIGVDELLVVTFTRAAASEMKERISKRLAELSEDALSSGDSAKASRLRRASIDCENANISTIHSFCTNVLHRNYHEVGLDPAFRVAEEMDAELLASKALNEVLEAAFLDSESHPDEGFTALRAAVLKDDALETLIRSLYRFAIARPAPMEWLDAAAHMYTDRFAESASSAAHDLMEYVCGELQVFFDEATALRAEVEGHRHIEQALDDDLSFIMSLMLNRDYDSWVSAIGGFSFSRLTWNTGTDESEKAGVKSYRDALKKYHTDLKKRFSHTLEEEERFSRILSKPISSLCSLTKRFAERYSELKQQEGLIDFSDMEQLTLSILKNPSIANEYRLRFRCVFVDEYQDINPAQEAILSAVSDGNRFMVGDVKQSIYRFRQAEPAIFLEKYTTYGASGEKRRIDLNSNFRSKPAILDAVNALFSKLMLGGAFGEIDYSDNAALVSGLSPNKDDTGSVELVLIDPELNVEPPKFHPLGEDFDDEGDDMSNASMQAAYAARRIIDMVENEYLDDGGSKRKYRWSDFTILLRSASSTAHEWLKTLSEAGIPCFSEIGRGFFDAVEVRLFIDLLRVIDNRRQDIPLLAVMRSSIFGFTDEELIHIKSDYDGEDMLDHVLNAANDVTSPTWSVKCRAMTGRIDSWRELAKLRELGELVAAVLDDTDFPSAVGMLYGGEARQSNLETLVNTAKRFSDSGRGSLNAFIRYLDDSQSSAKAAPASSAVSTDINAVKLMTIHRSKGLEFPVVILADMTKSFNRASNSAVGIFDSELGIGLCSVAGDRGSRSLLQRAIAFRELRRQNSEEMRMLYVAQTRAKQKLIMLGAKKRAERYALKFSRRLNPVRIMNASSYAEWVLGAYFPTGCDIPIQLPCGSGIRLEIVGPNTLADAHTGMSRESFDAWQQESAFLDTDELSTRFAADYAAKEDTLLPSKLSVTGLTLRPPEISSCPRFMEDEHGITGADIGILTHKLIQLISIRPHTEQSVRDELSALTEKGLFSPKEAALINIRAVARFFNSELGKRLLSSATVLREKEFNILMEANALLETSSSTPVMLQGVIDCCFIENGAWILVDHKTTHVDKKHSPRTVAERYRKQLRLYADALEKLTGIPTAECYVYLLSADTAVKM